MIPPLLDPRLHPWRPDLAAEHLRGRVSAERFATAMRHQVSAGVAPLRAAPQGDAEQLSQALHGDLIEIYDEQDGFGWGQMLSDGYVGWFDMAALSAPALPVTHRVAALRTYALADPSPQAQPVFLLSLNAGVVAEGTSADGRFVRCARAGWVAAVHLVAPGARETDPVAVAERFLGAPYQWGGVESLGLDCSGLVQMAFRACGIELPRDSDLQRAAGLPVADAPTGAPFRRGDLILWRGHVALATGPDEILHANAHHMSVVREPWETARDRIAAQYGPPLMVRRVQADAGAGAAC